MFRERITLAAPQLLVITLQRPGIQKMTNQAETIHISGCEPSCDMRFSTMSFTSNFY